MGKAIQIVYRNWKGEVAIRTIVPEKIWWGATKYHTEEQYLLTAWDEEKGENRDFAMKDIIAWLGCKPAIS